MPVFSSSEAAADVFGKLFNILAADENFRTRLRENGLTVHLVHTKPDLEIFISPDEVVVGEGAARDAAITIKMSCDTAHALWLGKLLMPAAVATGRVRIRGKIAKVLELVPILRPAFDRYAEVAENAGIIVAGADK
jgi:putative sterol carrier protein